MNISKRVLVGTLALTVGLSLLACKKTPTPPNKRTIKRKATKKRPAPVKTLVIYAGRSKRLVKPIIEKFTKQTGINVRVKYAKTAQLALLLQTELKSGKVGADVFWSQDAGALGLLEKADAFSAIPDELHKLIPTVFQSPSKKWLATSGRARVLAYAPKKIKASKLPKSVFALTKRKWRGKVGWAPTNASFQSFVTAMRVAVGNAKTKKWLIGMKKNKAKSYPKNTAIVKAIAAGEITLGLPNHYYLLRFKSKDAKYPVEQTFFKGRDIGNLVNIAGVGVLKASKRQDTALTFVRFLMSEAIQTHVTNTIFEYPMLAKVKPAKYLVPLAELLKKTPEIKLGTLADLKGTLKLLQDAGVP